MAVVWGVNRDTPAGTDMQDTQEMKFPWLGEPTLTERIGVWFSKFKRKAGRHAAK